MRRIWCRRFSTEGLDAGQTWRIGRPTSHEFSGACVSIRCAAHRRLSRQGRPNRIEGSQVNGVRRRGLARGEFRMVETRSQGLRATREYGGRPRAAEIASQDVRVGSKFRDGPNEIARRKPPAFPVRDRDVPLQAVHVDRNVNPRSREPPRKRPEAIAPVRGSHRGGEQLGLVASAAVIRPRVHLQAPAPQRPVIRKEAARPPILEAAHSPDARKREHGRELKRTIHPATARPAGRPNIPIRMIVKRDQRERLIRESPQPKRGEVVKVARPENQIRRRRYGRRNFHREPLDLRARRDEP